MNIIPAIDLMDGKCVRLVQGKKDSQIVYSCDPPAMARKWEDAGATRIHVVDLDGAFEGSPRNQDVIKNIRNAVSPFVEIEVGGGIRTAETINEYRKMGINYVIIGTKAIADRAFLKNIINEHGEAAIVGLDARDGFVSTHGWTVTEGVAATTFAKELQSLGVRSIIYTDISRDGMLTGPNLAALQTMALNVQMDVIASGGIRSIEDVQNILNLKMANITGIITGKSIYVESLHLKEAIKLACEDFKACN